MKGFGTVVTGTLLSGSIRVGDTLTLEPGSRAVRARGLQTHGRPEESVQSCSRVALNLAGIDVSDVTRGQTLVTPDTLTAVSIVEVESVLLPGVGRLRHRAQVRFHAFTADTLAGVSLYDYQPVEAVTRRLMRLRLHSPQVLAPGDRFVLRQCSPTCTIGGGVVMDAQPALPDGTALAAVADAYQAAGLAAPPTAEVAAKLNLTDAEMRRLMTLLLRDSILIRMGADALYIHQSALMQLRAQMSGFRGRTLDVAGFKQLTGLSRKYAISLLEYLDRERITRKEGNLRLVL